MTALTIGQTSEGIATMPGFGFAAAAETLAGQHLGADNADKAERAGWVSLQQGAALMVVMGAVFFALARPFAHIFTHDPHVVPLTVAYLRVTALSEPFLALGLILSGSLNGAGDTKAPAWAGITTLWGVRLPLAWLLIFHLHLGATGAWWAMTITTVLDGLIVFWLFKQGGVEEDKSLGRRRRCGTRRPGIKVPVWEASPPVQGTEYKMRMAGRLLLPFFFCYLLSSSVPWTVGEASQTGTLMPGLLVL